MSDTVNGCSPSMPKGRSYDEAIGFGSGLISENEGI